jgi:hypothetical protein
MGVHVLLYCSSGIFLQLFPFIIVDSWDNGIWSFLLQCLGQHIVSMPCFSLVLGFRVS